jgi:lipopolysaccharide assembly outer membrane protein LptD (OstA)
MKRLRFHRTIGIRVFVSLPLVICICAVNSAHAGGRKNGIEVEADAPPTEEPIDEKTDRSVYDLVTRGTEDELRLACERRGLLTEGDISTLRIRLMDWERERSLLPFDEKLKAAPESAFVLNHAEFIRYTQAENGDELILLSGNVDVRFGSRSVTADEVRINSNRMLITGSGNVRFVDGESQYRAESFFYDDAEGEAFFFESKTELGPFIYSGNFIRRIPNQDKYTADMITLTTEEIKNLHYFISADKLYYYDGKKALIKNASIHYGQDELLRLPYMYRNIGERRLRTALFFRERSGLVWQNTVLPYRADEKQLILKGDLYERLGFYTGLEYLVSDHTIVDLSVALGTDVYYYDDVTENWSNWGPPGASDYNINRSFRYRERLYKQFEFGNTYNNVTELNLLLISDPYYEYDYMRRSVGFDVFQFISQAQIDSPTKGSGYSWYLNNFLTVGNFSWYVRNNVRFEPQRNPFQDTASLNDFYKFQLFSITAPQTGVSYTDNLFEEQASPVISDIELSSFADYAYLQFYNPDETISSRLHQTDAEVGLAKPYQFGNFVRFTPNIITGGTGQAHIDPTMQQTESDNINTLLWGQLINEWRFGPDQLYFDLKHNIRYKFFGPDDNYRYNRFRIHDVTLTGFLQFWHISNEISTAYDLRPEYNWTTGVYDPFVWDQSHFRPLTNTFVFSPSKYAELRDVLNYSIVESRFKTNQFIFGTTSPDVKLGRQSFSVGWDLQWNHNFVNPDVDQLWSIFHADAHFHRYWKVYATSLSVNEDMWLYFPDSARARGREPLNPLVDLLKSFNFFNTDDRKASNFKLKSISFGFVRDLHEWELYFDYTGNRILTTDGRTYQWEQTFTIGLGLKKVESANVYTTVQRRE